MVLTVFANELDIRSEKQDVWPEKQKTGVAVYLSQRASYRTEISGAASSICCSHLASVEGIKTVQGGDTTPPHTHTLPLQK